MAIFSSTGAAASGKSSFQSFPVDASPTIVNGLVQHPALSPSAQVQILSIVDATGSASIGDIVAELPDSPDAVSAILALVAAGVLSAIFHGALDASTMVSRPARAPIGGDDRHLPPSPSTPLPASLDMLDASPFAPQLLVGSGADRRDFARASVLSRPGVYILMNAAAAYVGFGTDVGHRIATGQQAIDDIQTVIALIDGNDRLTVDDARAVERILWSRLAGTGERKLVNGVPDGAVVDVQRYSELDAFVAQACLALRHDGLLFVEASARAVLAGPRSEPDRIGKSRPFNQMPAGKLLELNFGDGLVALAARRSERDWLLLAGSNIRINPVPSANSSASFLRSAWLHSGLITLTPDGHSYTTQRDLTFSSGSAAAHFCAGAKGHGIWAWHAADPDCGADPEQHGLVAA